MVLTLLPVSSLVAIAGFACSAFRPVSHRHSGVEPPTCDVWHSHNFSWLHLIYAPVVRSHNLLEERTLPLHKQPQFLWPLAPPTVNSAGTISGRIHLPAWSVH